MCIQFNNNFILFLQKLADLSPSPSPRLIDGILLTKFDTIDDKVRLILITFAFFFVFEKLVNICFCVGWSCTFDGLHIRSACDVCRVWTVLYGSQKAECQVYCEDFA